MSAAGDMAARLRSAGDSLYWALLVGALVGAAGLILWLDRGTTYNIDQLRLLLASPNFDLRGLLEPQNGNLILTTTLAYKVLLGLFGTGFLPFRIIHVAAMVLAATLFFIVAKRRVGPLVALAPTVVLLFFGSDWGHVATALGYTVFSSIAAGLGALLMLDRKDRVGDIGAAALLVISVASFSTGLAFTVGAGVSINLAAGRLRRSWVYLLPLGLYAIWFIWAQGSQSPSDQGSLSNILLAPSWAFTSLAAVLTSLTGLGFDFSSSPIQLIPLGPGPALAVLAISVLAWRFAGGDVPKEVWVALAILLTYWTLGALVSGTYRVPTKTRYMYPGAVMLLLVATGALSGTRLSRFSVVTVFVVAGAALATNLALMRDGAAWFRNSYSAPMRAEFTMLDLSRRHVEPNFAPDVVGGVGPGIFLSAGEYLAATKRYGGSPGFSLSELAAQPEQDREIADRVLGAALGIRLEQPAAATNGGCRRFSGDGARAPITLPSGRTIEFDAPLGARVWMGRFSDSTPIDLGQVQSGSRAALEVPKDRSRTPWRFVVRSPGSFEICGLGNPTGTSQ